MTLVNKYKVQRAEVVFVLKLATILESEVLIRHCNSEILRLDMPDPIEQMRLVWNFLFLFSEAGD